MTEAAAVETATTTAPPASSLSSEVVASTPPPVATEAKEGETIAEIKEPGSKQFAKYHREQKQIKAERAAVEAERATIAKQMELVSKFKENQELYEKNPTKMFADLGMDLNTFLANAIEEAVGAPPAAAKSQDEVTKEIIEKELAVREAKALKLKQEEEQNKQKAKEDRAILQHAIESEKVLNANPERFEFCLSNNVKGTDIVDVIILEYNKAVDAGGTPQLLSYEAAADKIEAYFEKAEREKLLKLSTSKKLGGLLNLPKEELKSPPSSATVSKLSVAENAKNKSNIVKKTVTTNLPDQMVFKRKIRS